MPNPNRTSKPDIEKSEQELFNKSFDREFDVLAVEALVYNSNTGSLDRMTQPGAAAAPSTLVAFRTTVTTAGTRVQLGTNTISGVVIQAPSTNTGIIYVGGSNVSSTVFGAELQPGQSTGLAIDNTDKIYIDASVSGDKCAVLGS